MKKGLLSILAGALLVVGCQNYDDQFDQLESQISALSSTVAGLSQVQSDLSSLAGTVSSLASTVNGLGDAIDTAVADGLADIQADIADIEAAVEAADSSQAVSELSAAVAEQGVSLEELLANSSIFTGDVVINTQNTLDVFHAMGSTLAIVNGNVDIDVTTSMDIDQVQEVVDQILNVTKEFNYAAGADVDTEVTFSNLAGTATLTIDQEGGYMLENLTSATVITLNDDTSVDVVHLGSLSTVTSINGGNIHFEKATELHLTSMASYDGDLSLKVAKGGVIDLSSYRDVDTDGDATGDNLTIYGPASFTVSELDGTGSTLSFEEVPTVVVNGYNGTVVTLDGVENFTSDNLVDWTSTSADLVSVNVTGALDSDEDEEDEDGPAIALTSKGDLEDITISGEIASINLTTNGNLTDVTIDATVGGAITLDGNSDLVNVTLTGATATGITVNNNSDLEALTIDYTSGPNADDEVDGSVVVTNNESLLSLTVSTNNLETLTVQTNADLETIDFTGVDAVGATAEPTVDVSGNSLVASKADAEAEAFTTESGMDTLKEYLEAVVAVADDATANVVFDEVDTYIDEDGDDQGSKTSGDAVEVLVLTPKVVTTAGKDAIAHKLAYGITLTGGSTVFGISADGGDILVDSANAPQASFTLSANETLAIAAIKRAAALTNADAYDLTIDAHSGYKPSGKITLSADTGADGLENTYGTYTATSPQVGVSDVLSLTIGGLTVTNSLADNGRTAAVSSNAHLFITDALENAWTAQYVTASPNLSLYLVNESSSGVLDITAVDGSGRRAFDKSYSISIARNASNTASSTHTPTLAWQYGATSDSSDNNMISNGIIVTVESQIAGVLLDAAKAVSITGLAGANVDQLSTTLKLIVENATSTTAHIYPDEARGDGAKGAGGDAVLPEAELDEVATAATATDNTAWLD